MIIIGGGEHGPLSAPLPPPLPRSKHGGVGWLIMKRIIVKVEYLNKGGKEMLEIDQWRESKLMQMNMLLSK
jgi:anti-sigma regulatory factor (Ser/Thr protein kinase)